MDSREYWMEIEGFPNYLVSSHGRVMNRKTDRILKIWFNNRGYTMINLWNANNPHKFLVHRLVALTFFNSDGIDLQVNHIDGDKTNNCIWNLELVTGLENMRHARRTGLFHPELSKNVRPVEIIETGDKYESVSACARAIDGRPSTISRIVNGIGKSHKGYTFRYADE